MSKLVERLRDRYCSNCEQVRGKGPQDDCMEAADHIEELEEELTNTNSLFVGVIKTKDAEIKRLTEITEDQLRTITALTDGVPEATGKVGSSAIILHFARLEAEIERLRDLHTSSVCGCQKCERRTALGAGGDE